MRISELLGIQEEADSSGELLPVLASTSRFVKEAGELLDASLQKKLAKWLENKLKNPTQLLGRLDRVSTYDFPGWNHYHLRYGNTILIHYMAKPTLLLLASVTDHRAVDGGSDEGKNLSAYLKAVDVAALEAKAREQAQASKEPILTYQQIQMATELIYELLADEKERDFVAQAIKTNNISPIQDWFSIADLPIDNGAANNYLVIAKQALKTIRSK